MEKSLGRLRTDRIDLFFVHGMRSTDVHHTRDVIVPELLALQDAGKIRFLAASEAFASDHGHDALGQSLDAGDDWYDVLMVGHNPFNPSSRDRVLAATEAPRHRRARDVRGAQGAGLARRACGGSSTG